MSLLRSSRGLPTGHRSVRIKLATALSCHLRPASRPGPLMRGGRMSDQDPSCAAVVCRKGSKLDAVNVAGRGAARLASALHC